MAYPDNFDEVLYALGKFGRWQILRALALSLVWIHAAQSMMAILVIGYTPQHWCRSGTGQDDGNGTLIAHGTCELLNTTTNVTSRCLFGYEYAIPTSRSLVSEFDLVCDRNYITQTSQTIYMLGQAVGGYLVTIPADKFGRKIAYLCAYLLFFVSGVATSFAPNVDWFIALMFVNGIAQMGVMTTIFVQVSEVFPTDASHYLSLTLSTMWDVGATTIAIIAYLFQDVAWRYAQLTITLISAHVVFQIWFLDESIRWLYANGRHAEAYRILQKAARINKVDMGTIDDCLRTSLELIVPYKGSDSPEPEGSAELERFCALASNNTAAATTDDSKVRIVDEVSLMHSEFETLSFLDIFRHGRLRCHFLVMGFIWPTIIVTYYGITLMVNQFAGDRIFNLFLSGIVPLFTKPLLFLTFFLNRFGRRTMMIGTLTLCLAAMITAAVLTTISDESMASTVFMYLGKASIASSFITAWIYTPELYPTNLRSLGLGTASSAARLMGMVAPFFGYMAIYIPWGPGAISAVLCLVSALLVCLLPETWKKPLAQTLHDIDAL